MSKLVFAAAILLAGLAVHGALRRRAEGLPPGLRTFGPRIVLLLAIGVPAVILFFSVFRIIPAGHVGVKVLFGQVETEPLREGLNVVWNPLYDIVVMDGRVGKHVAKYDAASKDLQAVHVEMVLNYRLHPDGAPEVYKAIGLDYSSVIIDPAAQEVLQANTATHNADATRIKGEAAATYNARVSSSLTSTLIQRQYLSRWDGRLPQYSFGGNAVPLVQVPSLPGGGTSDGNRR